MDKQIIKKLANQLEHILAEHNVDLNQSFLRTKFDCPRITPDDLTQLERLEPFRRQIELKKVVGDLLHGSFEDGEINEWIVHRWGGIPAFNLNNHDRITNFRDHLADGRILPAEFNCISSLSKIASFVSNNMYFIFDSRVAFALDGLLLKIWQGNPDLPIQFFPLPKAQGGRHESMKELIRQLYPNAVYLSPSEAYIEYNFLILALNKEEALNKGLPPYWIEMLLFELGKTNGVIAGMFNLSQIKKNKPKTDNAHSQCKLDSNDKIPYRKEPPIEGWKLISNEYDLYLYIGKDSKKTFCELFSPKNKYPEERKLCKAGFEKAGGQKPYYIKVFGENDIDQAKLFMNDIKESLLKK